MRHVRPRASTWRQLVYHRPILRHPRLFVGLTERGKRRAINLCYTFERRRVTCGWPYAHESGVHQLLGCFTINDKLLMQKRGKRAGELTAIRLNRSHNASVALELIVKIQKPVNIFYS
jgi:hypothetical protein